MDRVVHFEITADDPQRAAEFYRKAFGWTFQAMPGRFTYLLATTGKDKAGIDGAIMGRTEMKQSVINTIAVDDFEASVKAVIAAGGQMVCLREGHRGQRLRHLQGRSSGEVGPGSGRCAVRRSLGSRSALVGKCRTRREEEEMT
jgi:predicted enzyme related to lactoylglutathione lyase